MRGVERTRQDLNEREVSNEKRAGRNERITSNESQQESNERERLQTNERPSASDHLLSRYSANYWLSWLFTPITG